MSTDELVYTPCAACHGQLLDPVECDECPLITCRECADVTDEYTHCAWCHDEAVEAMNPPIPYDAWPIWKRGVPRP